MPPLSTWLAPILQLRLRSGMKRYMTYVRDWRAYSKLPHAEKLHISEAKPMLFDATSTTGYDAHYLYQGVWLFNQVQQTNPAYHIDVGSLIQYSAYLSQITNVYFLDIRPAQVELASYTGIDASVLALPFATNSISSLSCLHVVEHIGLGRYGDPLDPEGSIKAIAELARILAPNGYLYFSMPIGRPRVQFNAHRIHQASRIMELFANLTLEKFAVVDDAGHFHMTANPLDYDHANYACGMFCYRKSK